MRPTEIHQVYKSHQLNFNNYLTNHKCNFACLQG